MAAKVPREGKRVQIGSGTASLFSMISTRIGLQQPMTLQPLALRVLSQERLGGLHHRYNRAA